MSVYLAADGGEPAFVASNTGWGELSRWVESLGDTAPNLRHLCEHGWEEPAGALAVELEALTPPDDEDVAGTLAELKAAVADAQEDAALTVTGGQSAEPGAEE